MLIHLGHSQYFQGTALRCLPYDHTSRTSRPSFCCRYLCFLLAPLRTIANLETEGNVWLLWAWAIRCCGFWADSRRGGSVFPLAWLSVSSYFYSKADCSVSGCLYAISIIKGEERPLLHASQRDDTSPPASPRVESFFFHIAGCLCFFSRCLWCRQSQRSLTVCVFLDWCWLADSFAAVQGRNGQAH